MSFTIQPLVTSHLSFSVYVSSLTSEKEAEKIKERLAQEEAEAMEMEDEENKTENTNNEKEVCKEFNQRDQSMCINIQSMYINFKVCVLIYNERQHFCKQVIKK